MGKSKSMGNRTRMGSTMKWIRKSQSMAVGGTGFIVGVVLTDVGIMTIGAIVMLFRSVLEMWNEWSK